MQPLKVIAIIFALVMFVGIGVGLLIGDSWFQSGEASIIVFLGVFFGYCFWKRPDIVASPLDDAFEDQSPPPRTDVLSSEHELCLKIVAKDEEKMIKILPQPEFK